MYPIPLLSVMPRARLLMAPLLVLVGIGILVVDRQLAPWYPLLLVCVLVIGVLAVHELIGLLDARFRPEPRFVYPTLVGLLLVNWVVPLEGTFPEPLANTGVPAAVLLGSWVAVLMLAFLVEMARFSEPGGVVVRLALTFWSLGYIGLLGSCLIQLRWLDPSGLPLAVAFFVPKAGDIGAYLFGHLLGRHLMSPRLSPKKTWEGAAGGMLFSVLAMLGLLRGVAMPAWSVAAAIAFGIAVSLAAQLGDLAESLIKRDGNVKDAAARIPGFGGVLDVIDSILFAAPVVYLGWRLAG